MLHEDPAEDSINNPGQISLAGQLKMATHKIRISENAFKGASGAMFALAIMAAASRTFIRLHPVPRITLDDTLLLFACVCLTASTGLLLDLVPREYLQERLNFGQLETLPFPISDLPGVTVHTVSILDAYTVFSWMVIYAAKFCYLIFFRQLVDRLRPMVIYWQCVMVITFLLGALSLCETFIACPRIDASAAVCLQGSLFHRTLVVGVVAKCLDILTDLLLISIPISLLWKVRIRARQKLGIGAFLCLSIVMIIICIVKASGIRTPVHSFDVVWETFWQQMEACTAVMMVSFTAFRSVFVTKQQRTPQKRASPMIFLQRKLPTLLRTGGSSSGEGGKHLSPTLPSDETPTPPLIPTKPAPMGRRKEIWESDESTTFKNFVVAQPQDLERGKDTDSGAFGSWDIGTSSSMPSDLGKYSKSSYKARKRSDGGHWWQISLVSNFIPSRSTGVGTSDVETMSSV